MAHKRNIKIVYSKNKQGGNLNIGLRTRSTKRGLRLIAKRFGKRDVAVLKRNEKMLINRAALTKKDKR